MKVKVTVDGDTTEVDVRKSGFDWWTAIVYRGREGGTAYIDIRPVYKDGETRTGWEARACKATRKAIPELANVTGTGKTMGRALEPFYASFFSTRRRAAEQKAFEQEQLTIMQEIAACFEPRTVQQMLAAVEQQLVLPWEWSDHHGGTRKDGAGRELARVWCPVPGVVCWKSTKHLSANTTRSNCGYVTYEDDERSFDHPQRRRAVNGCREVAEAWLREQGVLPRDWEWPK